MNVSWGQISGTEYVLQLFNDHVIHAWDLARGIGADDALDPELVEILYAGAKPREKELESYGVFGKTIPVPDEADTQTKLLGLFGRER